MYDLLIIGAGPGGVSAAIYAKRAGISVLVIDKGESALLKAHMIENFYGTGAVSGSELFEMGISQLKQLDIEVLQDEVLDLECDFETNIFKVKAKKGEFEAKSVIIATGNKHLMPPIKGIGQFEGKGVSFCATCDGFFYRGKVAGVVGSGEFALEEASYLANICKEVLLFTNGDEILFDKANVAENIRVIDDKILEVSGEMTLDTVLAGDEKYGVSGLFIATGTAGSVNFAKKVGIETEGDLLVVYEDFESSLPMLFAIGDCIKGIKQVAKAVYEGMVAATAAVKKIKKMK